MGTHDPSKGAEHQDPDRIFRVASTLIRIRSQLFPPGSTRSAVYAGLLRPLMLWLARQSPGIELSPAFLDQSVTLRRQAPTDASALAAMLVIKVDHIGDFITGLPACKLLREAFPDCHITMLCSTWNRALAEATQLFDSVVCLDIFPERSGDRSFKIPVDARQALSALPAYDVAVDLKVEGDSRFLLDHIRSPCKAGFEPGGPSPGLAISLPVPRAGSWAEMDRQAHNSTLLYTLASAVVARYRVAADITRVMGAVVDETASGSLKAIGGGPLVGINAGSGNEAKNWPLQRFVSYAKRAIEEFDATIVLFGSSAQLRETDYFRSALKESRLVDLTGKLTINGFAATVREMDLFVGNDTGTTHIAAALGTRTVCIFSGVGPIARFAPIGERLALIYKEMPCAPCGIASISQCTNGHSCMVSITVQHVVETSRRLLEHDSMTVVAAPSADEAAARGVRS